MSHQINYYQKYINLRNQLINRYKCCVITGAPPNICDIVYIQPFFRLVKSKFDIDNCLLLRIDLINLYYYNQLIICPYSFKVYINNPYFASINNIKINIHKDSIKYIKQY